MMSQNPESERSSQESLAPELFGVARSLEKLAETDRHAAPPDLEDRIARAAGTIQFEPAGASRAARFLSGRWRLAAGLVLASGALLAALWLGGPQPAPQPSEDLAALEHEIDEFLTITASWEESDVALLLESLEEEEEASWDDQAIDELLSEDSL